MSDSGDLPTDAVSPKDSSAPSIDSGAADAIFELEDTRPAPTCDGGGSYCEGVGCVDLMTDEANCGMCGKACPGGANAVARCTSGACGLNCNTNYADCDGTASTGCEANTLTDEANCGGCGTACATGETCSSGSCRAPTTSIETYELGTWPWSPWVNGAGSSAGTVTSTCAHDGARGYLGPSSTPMHFYRTDVSVGAAGTKLTTWFKPGSGRIYIGFGASSAGAYSVVAAPNTSQFYIERNMPFGTFTSITSKSRTWTATAWYKMEITFGSGGLVTARLLGADGTTLIDTISTTISGLAPGGVALRAFGTGACVDTIQR